MDIWDVDEDEDSIYTREDPVTIAQYTRQRFENLHATLIFVFRLAEFQEGMGLDGKDIMASLDNLKRLKEIYEQ